MYCTLAFKIIFRFLSIIFVIIFFRLLEHFKKHKDDFARVAPYLIADILHLLLPSKTPALLPNVKSSLISGINRLLDICDSHSKEFLSANLKEADRAIFKDILDTYNTYHRFKGAV